MSNTESTLVNTSPFGAGELTHNASLSGLESIQTLANTSCSPTYALPELIAPQPVSILSADSGLFPAQFMPEITDTLGQAMNLTQNVLTGLVGNPTTVSRLELAFGNAWAPDQAVTLLQGLVMGSQQPGIQIVGIADLQAKAAFGNDTVFIAKEFLTESTPDVVSSVLLEEFGHYLDAHLNSTDSPGDEGAIFAAIAQYQPLTNLTALKTEDDSSSLFLNNQVISVEQASLDSGMFVVGGNGQVTIDFLFDSGAYQGQVAIFSLEGMGAFKPGSSEYIKEASRRALTNSTLGHIVISDQSEGAQLAGELGEANLNSGNYDGIKTLTMTPGELFAIMLVPNGTIQQVFDNPSGDDDKRPLFSVDAANPKGLSQIGQLVKNAADGITLAMEDQRVDRPSDLDFNDVIFTITGATGYVKSVNEVISATKNWQTLELGKQLMEYATKIATFPEFSSLLAVSQDSLLTGNPVDVVFSVNLSKSLLVDKVDVFAENIDGSTSLLGSLFDDGDLDKGDDIADDGSYSNVFSLQPNAPGILSYFAVLPEGAAKTETLKIDVFKPLSDEEFQASLDQNAALNQQLQTLISNGETPNNALAAVQAQLITAGINPATIVITDSEIFWEDQNGILNMLDVDVYSGDVKNGTGTSDPDQDASVDKSSVVGDNKALVLAPYAWQFEPFDEANEIATKLKTGGFSVVEKRNTLKTQGNVTVEDFKNLQQYTTIAISSHGGSLGANDLLISTGQKATIFNYKAYQADLKAKRLVLGSDGYAVTSSFIRKYTDNMPDTIVYVSACESTASIALADAFLDEGASAYIGYSDTVSSKFADPRGKLTFDTLLTGKTTGEIPGINVDQETDDDPALFELIGSTTAKLSIFDPVNNTLINGSFEFGYTGWKTNGDARVISSLGPLFPSQGNKMSIISTGLGSVNNSQSSISQTFLVPTNAKQLKFSYNVISEEPLEFVDTKFDDQFEVLLNGTQVASERVNTSVWKPVNGINFSGGDSTVFQTGLTTVTLDLAPYVGQAIELKFRCFDKGDSIYDTAALIDNVQVTTA